MPSVRVVLAAPRGRDVDATAAEAANLDPGMESLRALVASATPPAATSAEAAVVIDVLRATTTLTVARARGAGAVLPAGTIEEARVLARAHPGTLLCGERDGRIIPGFDLGNSPFEYTRERIAGKPLVFASTNGSQALRLCAAARRIWVGAFVNAAAVVDRVAGEPGVVLVASGKLGEPAIEDVACAGWIARGLLARGFAAAGPEVALAVTLAPADAGAARTLVEHCSHARMLEAIGPAFVRDVELCATLDAIDQAWTI